MSLTDELLPLLKKLRLSGILQSLDVRTQQAVEENLSHTEFLYRLMSDEVARRDAKQLDGRLRRACFEHTRTLEDFDFQFNTSVPRAKILELGTCAFVDKRDNVLLVGPPGSGEGVPRDQGSLRGAALGAIERET